LVRVVQTLWFETISVLSQPLIDTPVGMITIRQGLLVGAGAVAGYVVYRLASSLADPFLSTGTGLIPFVLCAMTAAKKVKTIPPEQYLLLLFRPRQRPGGRAKAKGNADAGAKRDAAGSPLPAPAAAPCAVPEGSAEAAQPLGKPVSLRPAERVPEDVKKTLRAFLPPLKAISAVIGEDGEVTISEVLKNPKTGAPLLNTNLYASVGNKIIAATSDEKGVYTIKLYPSGPGSYYLLVAVQGFGTPVDSILVNVASKQ